MLWFELDDFDAAVARADELKVKILRPLHRNSPNGRGDLNHCECWLREPNRYSVVLASPDGTRG